MAKVYFIPIDSYSQTEKISYSAGKLLARLVKDEKVDLGRYAPIKVHFGEKGNRTFIGPDNYNGIIAYLKKNGVESAYTETNVLYRGERTTKKAHTKLAREHGFTQLPIVIADGDHGDDYEDVRVDGKRMKNCKVGAGIAKLDSLIVAAHFKGHMLAGFGGAIKQLGMGCAARGGKLAMHANAKPFINPLTFGKCRNCNICVDECPADAITVGTKPKIDRDKCVGCATCIAVCPEGVFKINWLGGLARTFSQRLVEHAYAAQKDKTVVYVSFALNITRGCDCAGYKMKPVVPDVGVFASSDPVAIDQACLDMIQTKMGRKRFGGRYVLEYGEEFGLGKREYELVEMK